MTRVDLYGAVHKGLRVQLFETAALVGRTDFTRAREASEVAERVARLTSFLCEHAEHEDRIVLPVLAEIAPELAADLRADHARVEGLGAEVAKLGLRLQSANEAERVALGRRLYELMWRQIAEQLTHMEREEVQANRALWAHRSDEQLGALHGRIVGSIEPVRMSHWLELMLVAMNGRERAALLSQLNGGMPETSFEELTARAHLALGEIDWNAAMADARELRGADTKAAVA